MNGKMRAAVLVEPERFAVSEVDRPDCGPDDVLIRVRLCGICGTDVHIFKGHYAADRLPLIPGHEFAGEISDIGANVTALAVGQRVIADINVGCGVCFYCRRNEVLNCPSVSQIGIHRDGAFAEYVRVPARLVIPIPDRMSFEVAALAEPLACVVRAAKRSRLQFGESVLVLGAGPIGNLHVQLARAIGLAPIIAMDLDPRRAELARQCGADIAFSDPAQMEAGLRSVTEGRGPDVVIESVGSVRLYEQALKLVRPGGRVMAFGLADASATARFSPFQMVLQEIGIQGSVAGMGEDMFQALTLLAHGRIDTEPFLRTVRPLADVQAAIEAFASEPTSLKVQIAM